MSKRLLFDLKQILLRISFTLMPKNLSRVFSGIFFSDDAASSCLLGRFISLRLAFWIVIMAFDYGNFLIVVIAISC